MKVEKRPPTVKQLKLVDDSVKILRELFQVVEITSKDVLLMFSRKDMNAQEFLYVIIICRQKKHALYHTQVMSNNKLVNLFERINN